MNVQLVLGNFLEMVHERLAETAQGADAGIVPVTAVVIVPHGARRRVCEVE